MFWNIVSGSLLLINTCVFKLLCYLPVNYQKTTQILDGLFMILHWWLHRIGALYLCFASPSVFSLKLYMVLTDKAGSTTTPLWSGSFHFLVLELELRASYLSDKYSTTRAMPQSFYFQLIFPIEFSLLKPAILLSPPFKYLGLQACATTSGLFKF
jgi:hypothetical protein